MPMLILDDKPLWSIYDHRTLVDQTWLKENHEDLSLSPLPSYSDKGLTQLPSNTLYSTRQFFDYFFLEDELIFNEFLTNPATEILL